MHIVRIGRVGSHRSGTHGGRHQLRPSGSSIGARPRQILAGIIQLSLVLLATCGSLLATAGTATADSYSATILADGPISYYRLGEASGTSAVDSSPAGNHGLYGTSGVSLGASGAIIPDSNTALLSAGTGTAMTASAASFPYGGSPRTLETWIKTTATTDQSVLSYGNLELSLVSSGGVLKWDDGSGPPHSSQAESPYPLNDGNWHLLDMTSTASSVVVYVDGQQIAAWGSGFSTGTGHGLYVGDGNAGRFSGSIDEIAIYDTALISSKVNKHWRDGAGAACPGSPSGAYGASVMGNNPLRYFRLGETGRVVADYSSYCQAAAYRYSSGHTAGGVGDADLAVTTGASAGTMVSGSAFGLPYGNSARTVELWMSTTATADQSLLSYGDFQLDVKAGSGNIGWRDGSGPYIAFDTATPYSVHDGNWHQVALTSSGSEVTLFVDGQQAAVWASAFNTGSGAGIRIGNGPSGPLAGSIDEVAIFDQALSAAAINGHWRAASGASCPGAASGTYASAVVGISGGHLVRYFRVGEGSGRVAADQSGNCRAGAYNYAATHVPGALAGDGDSAAGETSPLGTIISGSGDGLPYGDDARTVEMWIKTNTLADDQTLISYGNFELQLTGKSSYLGWQDSAGPFHAAGHDILPIRDGYWHQIDFTHDPGGGGAKALFVDGSPVYQGSGAMSTGLTPGNGDVLLVGNGGKGPLSGGVDEIAIYDIALSADAIAARYALAAPIGGRFDGSQTYGCQSCAEKHERWMRTQVAAPIDPATGNMTHDFVDISIPGRSRPLAVTRTYNSLAASTDGPFGYGWSSSLFSSLSCAANVATIVQENGSTAAFKPHAGGDCTGGVWDPVAPRYLASLVHNPDGTWTFERQGQDTFVFDASGRQTAYRDRNDYLTSFGYSGSQLTSMTDDGGRSLTFTWTGSHITRVTDANISLSRTVDYGYDGQGNLTDVSDLNHSHSQFGYSTGSHLMTSMRDPNCVLATTGCNAGQGVQTHYDAANRADWQKDELGHQTTLDYSSIPGATKITDPAGHVSVQYFSWGLRVAETRGYGTPEAGTWNFAFDRATLAIIWEKDPNGRVTTTDVDTAGNPLVVTDPLGRQTIRTFNSFNEPLTERDGNLVTTTYGYDTNGNLSSISRPLTGTSQVQTTTFNRTDTDPHRKADLMSMVDPDGKTWAYSYDANGYLASSTSPVDDVSTQTFNAVGWRLTTVSPKGNVAGCSCAATYTTSFGYVDAVTGRNNFGDPISVRDPLVHGWTKHYDANRNVDSMTDGDGNVTTYAYDLADRLTDTRRADSPQTTTATQYNADGTVFRQLDGAGQILQEYSYDAQGRPTGVKDGLVRTTTTSYDPAGNILTTQDPGGACGGTPKVGCTTRTYDAANQLKTVSYSDSPASNVTNVAYDDDGQRTGMTDGTGTSAWAIDSLHRLTSHTNGAGAQVQYKYNLRDLVTSIAYPGGSCGTTPTLCVSRGYDDAGRWTSVQDWELNTTSFGYDHNSNQTTTTTALPSGTSTTDTNVFDAADRLTSKTMVAGATAQAPYPITYNRDANNQLTSDSSAMSNQQSYRYSPLNQLCYAGSSNTGACASPPSGAQSFGYDSGDDLVRMGAQTQKFDAAHQLCWTLNGTSGNGCSPAPGGATTYGYDTRGNRTSTAVSSGGTTCYSYDQANRLTGIGTTSGSGCGSPSGVAAYSYNGDGLRMSKTVGSTTTSFAWDQAGGLPLLLQEVPTGGTPTRYVYGPGGLVLEQLTSQPAITRVGTPVGGSEPGTASSLTVAFPTGVQPGDQILLATTYSTGANNSVTTPSGYTLAGTASTTGGANPTTNNVTKAFWHTAIAGDSQVTIGYSGNFAKAAVVTAYRGVDGVAPVDVIASNAQKSTATISVTGSTRYRNDELVLFQGATYLATGRGTWTGPTGMTEEPSKDARTVTIGMADAGQAAVGATGALTSTFSAGTVLTGPNLTGLLVALKTPPAITWHHKDQIGSTRLLTDIVGAPAASYTFDPYGNIASATVVEQASTSFGFTGQYRDPESGLIYLRARYYDPATGQFTSRDPMVSDTWQPFAFVAGSPLNRVDPSGLYDCGWEPWNCIRPDTAGWDQFASNASNPQSLAIAGIAGVAVGALAAGCLFGGCEALAGLAGIGASSGIVVEAGDSTGAFNVIANSWGRPGAVLAVFTGCALALGALFRPGHENTDRPSEHPEGFNPLAGPSPTPTAGPSPSWAPYAPRH
ncbi:MAG: hypothetical protein QOE92_494 [Chloroflexota bacterium]|nr:hypothetical protein [Chloroflexota bacterium]